MNRQDLKLTRRWGAMKPALLLCAVPAAAILACTAHDLQTPDPQPEKITGVNRAVNPVRDLDIIFMIDNSGSMREEQDNLKRNFTFFVDELRKIPGGLPNVRMGVISSDVGAGSTFISGNPACNRPGGDRGEFQTGSGCGLEPNANFIISLDNEKMNNFGGKLEDVFGCMASLGTQGCGYEHQLLSVLASLDRSTTKNAGFLREDAYLAIILITDEDDCSGAPNSDLYADPNFPGQQASLRCSLVGHKCNGMNPPGSDFQTTLDKCTADENPKRLIPVKTFVDGLLALKSKDPSKIIVSAITGWPANATPERIASTPYAIKQGQMDLYDIEPACSSGDGQAAPALRIKQFVDSFGKNGIIESICAGDFRPALQRIGQLIAVNLDPGCIKASLVDTDPSKPGTQGECSVSQEVAGNVQQIPSCDSNGNKKPCFQLIAPGGAGNTCMEGWRVDVQRDGEAPKGATERIACRTCVDLGGGSLAECQEAK